MYTPGTVTQQWCLRLWIHSCNLEGLRSLAELFPSYIHKQHWVYKWAVRPGHTSSWLFLNINVPCQQCRPLSPLRHECVVFEADHAECIWSKAKPSLLSIVHLVHMTLTPVGLTCKGHPVAYRCFDEYDTHTIKTSLLRHYHQMSFSTWITPLTYEAS